MKIKDTKSHVTILCLVCVNTTEHMLKDNIYTLLDGLTYNTRGYFASCVVFF